MLVDLPEHIGVGVEKWKDSEHIWRPFFEIKFLLLLEKIPNDCSINKEIKIKFLLNFGIK